MGFPSLRPTKLWNHNLQHKSKGLSTYKEAITIENLNEAEKRVKVRRGEGRRVGKGRDELVEERDIKVTEAKIKKLNQIRRGNNNRDEQLKARNKRWQLRSKNSEGKKKNLTIPVLN